MRGLGWGTYRESSLEKLKVRTKTISRKLHYPSVCPLGRASHEERRKTRPRHAPGNKDKTKQIMHACMHTCVDAQQADVERARQAQRPGKSLTDPGGHRHLEARRKAMCGEAGCSPPTCVAPPSWDSNTLGPGLQATPTRGFAKKGSLVVQRCGAA